MTRQAEMKDFKGNILRRFEDSYGHCSSRRLSPKHQAHSFLASQFRQKQAGPDFSNDLKLSTAFHKYGDVNAGAVMKD